MATDSTPQTEEREPVIGPGQTFAKVTDTVSDLALARPVSRGWMFGLAVSFALVLLLLYAIGYVLVVGVGVWGINVPVGWGFAIINFVWWIGIGHAGTLISALLLLTHQQWRTSINRLAEAMTLFAVTCAGLFPLLHMGRAWYFYWLVPYPSPTGVWPQFRSPLVWDVFAISTYLIISLLFWWIGMIPDLATLRDRARSRLAGTMYAILAMGWRGDVTHWHRHKVAYLLVAGLAVPLSIHIVSSYNFAATILPVWNAKLFPPFFAAGSALSGVAMVLVLVIPVRAVYRLDQLITGRHLGSLGRFLLLLSWFVAYGYTVQPFMTWYGGRGQEELRQQFFGQYAVVSWGILVCNFLIPQALWFRRVRDSAAALWLIGLVVLIGMWVERYVLVISSLHRDFLPSSWGPFEATAWDWALFAGTFGLFAVLVLLFLRFLPVVPMSEMRELLEQKEQE